MQQDKKSADGVDADSFPLVPKENRAASFEAVAGKLDLGGEVFTFVDLGTVIQNIGTNLSEMMKSMSGTMPPDMMDMQTLMLMNMPYDQALKTLGLTDLNAIGMSSYREGTLYRNKAVLYLPEGPQGIFGLFGQEPHAFESLKLAPAGTDVFLEQDFSGTALRELIHTGAEDIFPGSGKQMAAGLLGNPVKPGVNMTWDELLQKLDTRITLVVELGEPTEFHLPTMMTPVNMPKFKVLIALKGLAWLVEDGIVPTAMLDRQTDGDYVIYQDSSENSAAGYLPSVITDSKTGDLYLTTHIDYFKACLAGKTSLTDDAGYRKAMAGLPTQGNSLVYVSRDAFNALVDARTQMEQTSPMGMSVLGLYQLYLPILGIDKVDADGAIVGVVEANSIFSDGRWPTSNRMNALSGGPMSSIATSGVLAAMAIPAFNKVRTQSREKAITNNLRQIASAGQQYILEEGVPEAGYDKLEGTYFNSIEPVAGENYTDLVVHEEGGTLEVTTASGETVSYPYSSLSSPRKSPPTLNKIREQSREKAIQNNLRQIAAAGQQYILEEGVPEANYDKLEGIYFKAIKPIAGENYTDLVVHDHGGTLEVTTDDGKTVSYEY